eukprot:TRINITY_DN5487_c0_g3_i1.p1 TRINITY_DN5487_c0_g3~~TRINITY_DN5487_c0_g3_i1.p1  ORF type:complete len:467 (-),score=79.92 TRINITY_DN5487_c0_g3_i1:176-1510(-)
MASSDVADSGTEGVRGYIDGCFDIMHSGHYNALRQAKAVCDVLVVGVHSDDEIATNKALPVMKQSERYALLKHIKWIDEILHDVPYSPQLATLDRARASFCVHGDDMPVNAEGFCAYDEMRDAGKLRIIRRTEGVSTTDLIGRLLTMVRQSQKPLGLGSTGESPKADVCASEMRGLLTVLAASAPIDIPEEAQVLLNELAAKYNITSEDTVRLCELVAQSNVALERTNSNSGRERKDSDVSDKGVRSAIPAHLLTSTRRIAEFSSSRMPEPGDTVVYVCGSFDMFHVGHAQFLSDARQLGDFLLVGVYDDQTVTKSKGKHLPVMHMTERVLNVCACKWADEVIISAPSRVTEDLIKTWNIKIVARGSNFRGCHDYASNKDPFATPKVLGIYQEIESKWSELCHETIVERIVASREAYVKRNLDRTRREEAYYTKKDTATWSKEA